MLFKFNITNQISHVTPSHHQVVRLHDLEVDNLEDTHSVILSLRTDIGP